MKDCSLTQRKTVVALVACALLLGVTGSTLARNGTQCGGASWYSLPGQRTASGQTMNPAAMTAAHRSLPFGSIVNVVDQRTGRSVQVTINDRGPFIKGRIIDLSRKAATQLGFRGRGTTKVCIAQI
jgi:rare lipoprotein A